MSKLIKIPWKILKREKISGGNIMIRKDIRNQKKKQENKTKNK